MSARRKVEVFSAGCPACKETIELINRHHMKKPEFGYAPGGIAISKASGYGVSS